MTFVRFNCPNCGQRLKADYSLIGGSLKCCACRESVSIPEPEIDNIERQKELDDQVAAKNVLDEKFIRAKTIDDDDEARASLYQFICILRQLKNPITGEELFLMGKWKYVDLQAIDSYFYLESILDEALKEIGELIASFTSSRTSLNDPCSANEIAAWVRFVDMLLALTQDYVNPESFLLNDTIKKLRSLNIPFPGPLEQTRQRFLRNGEPEYEKIDLTGQIRGYGIGGRLPSIYAKGSVSWL